MGSEEALSVPVESELLRLWVPLCWAGDPALDGGSRAPPRGWAQPFHLKKPGFHLLVMPKLKEMRGAPREA